MGEVEGEPEDEKLALGDKELLTVGHCEDVSVAQCVALLLLAPLPLRVPEVHAEAVPRKPSAAAPPVALTLPVPHPLKDTEWVGEVEGEPEDEKLALGVPDSVAHWDAVRLVTLLPLWAPEGEAEAVPLWPSAAAPPVALRLAVPQPLKDVEVVGDVEGDSKADAEPR